MLIATLPGIFRRELVGQILGNPLVSAVRYNTGAPSPDTPYETLAQLQAMTDRPIWVDLKCRQLRVAVWADPYYSEVELNHEVEVELPAQIHFRGVGWHDIKAVRGNRVFLVNPPDKALGKGQSVNIKTGHLVINGFWTAEDPSWIQAAEALGITNFILSFYEGNEDIERLMQQLQHPKEVKIGLKVESQKGLEAIEDLDWAMGALKTFLQDKGLSLIVARDDLLINMGGDATAMIPVLGRCLEIDQEAIVASQLFSGLEHTGSVTAADISDLHLLHTMGYQNFLLSDGICLRHFAEAMTVWEQYGKRTQP